MYKRPLSTWHTRITCSTETSNFGKKVKLGNKFQFGNNVTSKCYVWVMEGSYANGYAPEYHVGDLDFILFDKIPESTIENHHWWF